MFLLAMFSLSLSFSGEDDDIFYRHRKSLLYAVILRSDNCKYTIALCSIQTVFFLNTVSIHIMVSLNNKMVVYLELRTARNHAFIFCDIAAEVGLIYVDVNKCLEDDKGELKLRKIH